MARTTRTPRRRKAAQRPVPPLQAVGARAQQALASLAQQGAMLKSQGERLAAKAAKQAREALAQGADAARARTVEAVGTLEKVFEARVSKVVARLGVPSAREVRDLARQVAQLQQSVERLRRSRARA